MMNEPLLERQGEGASVPPPCGQPFGPDPDRDKRHQHDGGGDLRPAIAEVQPCREHDEAHEQPHRDEQQASPAGGIAHVTGSSNEGATSGGGASAGTCSGPTPLSPVNSSRQPLEPCALPLPASRCLPSRSASAWAVWTPPVPRSPPAPPTSTRSW